MARQNKPFYDVAKSVLSRNHKVLTSEVVSLGEESAEKLLEQKASALDSANRNWEQSKFDQHTQKSIRENSQKWSWIHAKADLDKALNDAKDISQNSSATAIIASDKSVGSGSIFARAKGSLDDLTDGVTRFINPNAYVNSKDFSTDGILGIFEEASAEKVLEQQAAQSLQKLSEEFLLYINPSSYLDPTDLPQSNVFAKAKDKLSNLSELALHFINPDVDYPSQVKPTTMIGKAKQTFYDVAKSVLSPNPKVLTSEVVSLGEESAEKFLEQKASPLDSANRNWEQSKFDQHTQKSIRENPRVILKQIAAADSLAIQIAEQNRDFDSSLAKLVDRSKSPWEPVAVTSNGIAPKVKNLDKEIRLLREGINTQGEVTNFVSKFKNPVLKSVITPEPELAKASQVRNLDNEIKLSIEGQLTQDAATNLLEQIKTPRVETLAPIPTPVKAQVIRDMDKEIRLSLEGQSTQDAATNLLEQIKTPRVETLAPIPTPVKAQVIRDMDKEIRLSLEGQSTQDAATNLLEQIKTPRVETLAPIPTPVKAQVIRDMDKEIRLSLDGQSTQDAATNLVEQIKTPRVETLAPIPTPAKPPIMRDMAKEYRLQFQGADSQAEASRVIAGHKSPVVPVVPTFTPVKASEIIRDLDKVNRLQYQGADSQAEASRLIERFNPPVVSILNKLAGQLSGVYTKFTNLFTIAKPTLEQRLSKSNEVFKKMLKDGNVFIPESYSDARSSNVKEEIKAVKSRIKIN